MIRTNILISVVNIVFLFDIYKSEILYVTKASNITMPCPFESVNYSVQWSGPPNLTLYSVNRKINSEVKGVGIFRGSVNGKFYLIIYGFEESNEGTYQCSTIIGREVVMYTVNVMLQIKKLSPDDISCTSDISITESFTTTDQTLNGNHQENTPGITRSEILLCCALVCILFLTMISYARNRQYITRKFNIIWQQNDNTPTDQRASETENIHLYSTVDDYSVQELPVVGDGRIQEGDNDYESNSSIPSRMDFDIEEDYIHPYNIPVYSFQDKKHDYEKLYHSGEYFASISHDGNDDEKSNTNTDIICASITPKGVQIGHVNIVKSSLSNEDTICKTYTDGLTNIHINGTNANTNKINQSSNCEVTHHKHHVFDDISLD